MDQFTNVENLVTITDSTPLVQVYNLSARIDGVDNTIQKAKGQVYGRLRSEMLACANKYLASADKTVEQLEKNDHLVIGDMFHSNCELAIAAAKDADAYLAVQKAGTFKQARSDLSTAFMSMAITVTDLLDGISQSKVRKAKQDKAKAAEDADRAAAVEAAAKAGVNISDASKPADKKPSSGLTDGSTPGQNPGSIIEGKGNGVEEIETGYGLTNPDVIALIDKMINQAKVLESMSSLTDTKKRNCGDQLFATLDGAVTTLEGLGDKYGAVLSTLNSKLAAGQN